MNSYNSARIKKVMDIEVKFSNFLGPTEDKKIKNVILSFEKNRKKEKFNILKEKFLTLQILMESG